jgi:hypothetical protein
MKPDDATIERCAMALRDHVANRALGTKREGRVWMALPSSLQQAYRDEVIVVLEAAGAVRCSG